MDKSKDKEKPTVGILTGTPLGLLASLFERDLRNFARYDTHAFADVHSDHVASLTFITSDFEYQLEVHNQDPTQMVAYWVPRRSVPGIPSVHRQILHGGSCSESTWRKILGAIVSRELVARAPQAA